ncbi:MAG: lipoyl(octanoyl) transferase LipB [Armatimonadota bacterium]
MSTECRLIRLGLTPYEHALKLQEKVLADVADHLLPETLILLEHPPTFTIGRAPASESNLLLPEEALKKMAEVYRVGRGGNVTFHGPGQLVGYPIMDLRRRQRDVHAYVRALEEVLIRVLKDYGISANREEGLTGVWVEKNKIAAIGVQVRRGVTMHGFALNVDPDLSFFSMIVPCGIRVRGVTSMSAVLGRRVSLQEVEERLIPHFEQVFDVTVERTAAASHW